MSECYAVLRLVSTWSFLSLQENGGQLVFVPYAMYVLCYFIIYWYWRILSYTQPGIGHETGWLVGRLFLVVVCAK